MDRKKIRLDPKTLGTLGEKIDVDLGPIGAIDSRIAHSLGRMTFPSMSRCDGPLTRELPFARSTTFVLCRGFPARSIHKRICSDRKTLGGDPTPPSSRFKLDGFNRSSLKHVQREQRNGWNLKTKGSDRKTIHTTRRAIRIGRKPSYATIHMDDGTIGPRKIGILVCRNRVSAMGAMSMRSESRILERAKTE